jgi:uncharacterized membrane protein
MQRFRDDFAISAVIGVILMVAITVAIAASVYVYVGGMEAKPLQDLEIQVNPPDYPDLYDNWEITVWKIINGTRYSAENITVIVEVYNDESKNIITRYELITNTEGKCQFEYSEPVKHKFTAMGNEFGIDYFQPAKKFINPNSILHITNLFNPTGLFLIIAIFFSIYQFELSRKQNLNKKGKKWKKILSSIRYLLYILIFIVFVVGMLLTSYLNSSQTSVGYPDNENFLYLTITFWTLIIFVITFGATLFFEFKVIPKKSKI